MAKPRVLLVEDDPALRRFVALALDELDIELVHCASVAAALAALEPGPVQLILTDLMMPGESGFDLLRQLRASPRLRGTARVVVLSAGLTSAVCERLAGLDVWRMLTKPVSVGALEACVREGLDGGAGVAMAAPLARPARRRSGASTTGGNEDQAIGAYFEGDRALFLAYRSACLERFPHDIREGDAASGSGDLVALRRVAHSLKSVLQMLGQTRCSVLARELEDTSHAGLPAPAPAQAQWAALREHLSTLLRCA